MHASVVLRCPTRKRTQFPRHLPGIRPEAAAELKAAELPIGICVTPMLPLADPEAFVQRLVEFDPHVLVVQDFHDSGGGFGADTGKAARQLLVDSRWTTEDYRRVHERIRERRAVFEGEAGFFPPISQRREMAHYSST